MEVYVDKNGIPIRRIVNPQALGMLKRQVPDDLDITPFIGREGDGKLSFDVDHTPAPKEGKVEHLDGRNVMQQEAMSYQNKLNGNGGR